MRSEIFESTPRFKVCPTWIHSDAAPWKSKILKLLVELLVTATVNPSIERETSSPNPSPIDTSSTVSASRFWPRSIHSLELNWYTSTIPAGQYHLLLKATTVPSAEIDIGQPPLPVRGILWPSCAHVLFQFFKNTFVTAPLECEGIHVATVSPPAFMARWSPKFLDCISPWMPDPSISHCRLPGFHS